MQTDKRQNPVDWKKIQENYKSGEGKKKLKEAIAPIIESVAWDYLDTYEANKEELIKVGFSSFDKALSKYYERTKRRREAGESTYEFSRYFKSWVRRDIEKYLGIYEPDPWWQKVFIKARDIARNLKTSVLLLLKK